ncbi:MAG TPA: DUF2225 domain-containing protein [Clostridiaceae bacterium]|nr:DUF2225 domain-containing protein [Clostridiaceae bacterium]
MNDRLYNKTVICPVCSEKIEVTRVKSRACKVVSRDSDFCVHYQDINPLLYEVWVCGNCGYAALEDKFESIGDKAAKQVAENISSHWKKRSFTGERNIDNAIEAFKLALYALQVTKARASEIAKVCLRLAWLYRLKNDSREEEFLKFALENYLETFEKEKFPVDKMDESTCMYIIAELNRRIGNFGEAVKWFSRIIASPEARKNRMLMEYTREQYQLTKEQIAATKE